MLFDVVSFVGLIRLSPLSISSKRTSLNEKLGIFFKLLLISKRQEWLLYLFIAFSTELISSLSVSKMSESTFIRKLSLPSSKNL